MGDLVGKKAELSFNIQTLFGDDRLRDRLASVFPLLASWFACRHDMSSKERRELRDFVRRRVAGIFNPEALETVCKHGSELTSKMGEIEGTFRVVHPGMQMPGVFTENPVLQLPQGAYRIDLEYEASIEGGIACTLFIDGAASGLVDYLLPASRRGRFVHPFEIDERTDLAKVELKTYYRGLGRVAVRRLRLTREASAPADPAIVSRQTETLRTYSERLLARQPSPVLPITPDPPLQPADIRRLKFLHNRFRGQRIFIMGSGPSLNDTPLHLLKNDHVFGVNRVSLLFDRIDWRPQFFTAFDVRVVPDNADEFRALDTPYKFFATKHRELMGDAPNHYYHHVKPFYAGFDHCFDPEAIYHGFGGGGTIAVIAIELAYYMGFDPIYLIGVDVNYAVKETVAQSGPDAFGDGVKLLLESTRDDDPNHFDSRYYGAGKKWHNPNVAKMVEGFAACRTAIERRGRRIYNATVGGKLEVLQRVDFTSLFS